jgi:peptidoglycan/LPS O-acetylase OafA/YrhL
MFQGGWAVQLFFCISGLLVFGSLQRRRETEKKPLRNFLIRRVFRIVPLWWAILIIQYFRGGLGLDVLFANMFFYFGFLSFNPAYMPITRAWSLFVEESFYWLLPLIVKSLEKNANILRWFLGTAIFAILWQQKASAWGVPNDNYFIGRSPLANIQFFFLGMLLYHIHLSTYYMEKVKSFAGNSSLTWLDLFALVSFGMFAFDIVIPPEVSIFLIVLATLTSGTLAQRFFSNRFLKWVGVRCYGVYLISAICIGPLMPFSGFVLTSLFKDFPPAEVAILFLFPIHAAVSLILAWVSYKFFERPLQALGERLLS